MYEENNVIRLVDSVFFHKSLEIPPPDIKKNVKQELEEPRERVLPIARLPNGFVVIEPGVLVHRLVVQELLCHLPEIVETNLNPINYEINILYILGCENIELVDHYKCLLEKGLSNVG